MEWKQYRRSQMATLRPYFPGETLSDRVSISASDREAGSPKIGDMIARNPKNHDDQWLIAAAYFSDNFETAYADEISCLRAELAARDAVLREIAASSLGYDAPQEDRTAIGALCRKLSAIHAKATEAVK